MTHEITLRDLIHWDRQLTLIPPRDRPCEAALERGVSWAVSVRAAPPHLPPLRGDELVVLPLRVVREIEETTTLSRAELLSTLAQQPIAAILTEPALAETPLEQLPLLTLPAPFPHDAEGLLNRVITERRGELYRLGSELSRRLAQAVLDPRGLEALLEVAAELSRHALLLQDDEGNPVASAGLATIEPADQRGLSAARQADGPILEPASDGRERLIVRLSGAGSTGYLSMTGPRDSLNEGDRLVLVQTAGTCSILLSQGRPPAADRVSRDRLVADLLLGRLASDAATKARALSLGLDPAAPVIVGLVETERDPAAARDILFDAFGSSIMSRLAVLPGERIAFLLQAIDSPQAARRLRRALALRGATTIQIALSEPVASVVEAPRGLRQARVASTLLQRGAIQGPVISCADPNDVGLFQLLYPLLGNDELTTFETAILGPLAAYDGRRDSRLIETLDAYLSSGGALAEAADQLGIHRNTLSYRLRRITELTGRDLADPQQRLLLQVALLIRRLPTMTGDDTG